MFMYKYDKRVLKHCKSVQKSIDKYVLICTENATLQHCDGPYTTDTDKASLTEPVFKLGIPAIYCEPALKHLIETGCIKRMHAGDVYQVTYTGWFSRELRRSELANKIMTHFLFPSLVAFITTILTLLLS